MMDWGRQTVLVTGAGGFIGSHLTERLVGLGAHTRALVHYNSAGTWGWLECSPHKDDVEVVLGDVRDQETVRRAVRGADIVFHLAALIAIPYSYQAPSSYVRTNVEGTLNVLQTAYEEGVKLVVHTSTSEVYGTACSVPIPEEHPLQAQSPYAASKIGADKLAEAFHRSFNLPVVTVRPFNTYGPRQSARAIIPTIITQALTKPALRLGHLEPTRDFNYVDDTVEGFIRAAACPDAVGRVINLGSGVEISIGDLVDTLLKLLGRNLPVIFDNPRSRPDLSEVERLCADNSRARTILEWSPRVTLKDGLGQTIVWIEKNLDMYKHHQYTI